MTDLEEDYYPDVIKLIGSKSSAQWELRAYHQNQLWIYANTFGHQILMVSSGIQMN